MGYNTVAFVLNDMLDNIRRCPTAAIFRLTTPAMTADWERRVYEESRDVGRLNGEGHLSDQALRVLPTFHSSETRYFEAGGNQIREIKLVKRGKVRIKDGKKTKTINVLYIEDPDPPKPIQKSRKRTGRRVHD